MLRWRFVSAAAIIFVLLVLGWLDYRHNFDRPGLWLLPLGLFACLTSTVEVLGLLHKQYLQPVQWTVYGGTAGVFLASAGAALWLPFPYDGSMTPSAWSLLQLSWTLLAMVAAAILALIGEMRRFEKPGTAIVHVAVAVFSMTYVGVLMSFLVALRTFGGNAQGMIAILSVIIIVKFSDIGAYAVGRLTGRHRLAPTLSPGKTIEGVVGGVVAACCGSWLMFYVIAKPIAPTLANPAGLGWLLYGIALAVAGVIGDLSESLLKRDMRQKDSSPWLPGFGGILDLIDSLLVAAPVAYFCWVIGLVRW